MVTQNLLQCIVEQVCCCMVGSTSVALISIYTCHELSLNILWQLLHDVYTLVVLALCVNNVDSLCLIDKYTLIANLSTHLAIERCVVEYELEKLVLLLCHLAVAQDVAVVVLSSFFT